MNKIKTIAAMLVAGLAASANAQTTIEVNAGQVLTEADLTSNSFMGQNFALGNQTVFEVNAGGAIGPVGVPAADRFSFEGSVINVRDGGFFSSLSGGSSGSFAPSVVGGADINIYTGGVAGAGLDIGAGTNLGVVGGAVGDLLRANAGSVLNLSDGVVGNQGQFFMGSQANISGGSLGSSMIAYSGSQIALTGGSIGEDALAAGGSLFEISGGSVASGLNLYASAVVNVSGGSIADGIIANAGSTLNLFVTDLNIGGEQYALELGESLIVTERGGALLTATLADGSLLELDLNPFFSQGNDAIATGATLSVTLVPSPASMALLGAGGLLAARRRRA